ncbi:CHAT domain-containing protein [Longivirga aurantiaca]|uniref:CHAT domain-containing protein n=1 Tax=Longivirga aurantiaca TaxID=1837743 RepID=A0ABW1SYD0_9ACTN
MTEGAVDAVDDVVARAEHALDEVGRDPRAALAVADAVVAAIPRPLAAEGIRAVVTAHRAAGLALRELSEIETAEGRMRRAVRIADRHERPDVGAEARMSLAYVLMERGRMGQAVALTTRALRDSRGETTYRLRIIRAMSLQRSGHGDDALAEYAVALPAVRRARDTVWESRLLNNRGILLATRGETARAVADFTGAREIFLAEGRRNDAADVLYNIGYLYGMAGDVPQALRNLDASAEEWGDLDRPEYWAGRAEVLTRAGLSAEAVADARRAIALLQSRGWNALEAESWLSLASALLSDREPDLDAVVAAAQEARRLVRRQGRPEWTAMAEYVAMSAQLRRSRSAPTTRSIERLVAMLEENHWPRESDDLRVSAAMAMHARSPADALQLLEPVESRRPAAGDWERRSTVALARSLRAGWAGDTGRAQRQLLRAWSLADDAHAALGSVDLVAGAAARSGRIVELGLGRALDAGCAEQAFDWVERGRSAVLRHPAARPAPDPEVAAALTRWRWAKSEEAEARAAGDRLSPSPVRAAEREVRRLTRRRAAADGDHDVIGAEVARSAVGDGVFVQFFSWKGEIHATTTTRNGTGAHRLGAAAEVLGLERSIAFALRRVVRASPSRPALDQAVELHRLVRRLDSLILAPLAAVAGARKVTICPGSALGGVPWSIAPSIAGADLTIAPSATSWHRARNVGPQRIRKVAALAGPGLPAAEAECTSVSRLHRQATATLAADATTAAVSRAAREVDVLHLAAHGLLRRDNPLFSSLTLADGPLCGYDIASWVRAPSVVVLSACSAAAGAAVAGEEVLGLAAIALGVGARTVVASPVAVPDGLTALVMTSLHRELAQGHAPDEALQRVRGSLGAEEPAAGVVAGTFVAVGA